VIEGIPCNKRDGEKRYFSRTLAAENFCLPAGDGIIEKLKIDSTESDETLAVEFEKSTWCDDDLSIIAVRISVTP